MQQIKIILLVFAFVCAVLATLGVGHPRCNLGWASLTFYFASILFG